MSEEKFEVHAAPAAPTATSINSESPKLTRHSSTPARKSSLSQSGLAKMHSESDVNDAIPPSSHTKVLQALSSETSRLHALISDPHRKDRGTDSSTVPPAPLTPINLRNSPSPASPRALLSPRNLDLYDGGVDMPNKECPSPILLVKKAADRRSFKKEQTETTSSEESSDDSSEDSNRIKP